jgi:hypothetical protein
MKIMDFKIMNLRFYTFLDPHIIVNTNTNLCSNGETMVICKLTKVIVGNHQWV